MLQTLLKRKLIAPAGHKADGGRALRYQTTRQFPIDFALKDRNGLPALPEFAEFREHSPRIKFFDERDMRPAAADAGFPAARRNTPLLSNDELVQGASLPCGADLSTEEPSHRDASDLLLRIRAARRRYAQPRQLYAVAADPVRQADLRAWLRAQLAVRGEADFGALLADRAARA